MKPFIPHSFLFLLSLVQGLPVLPADSSIGAPTDEDDDVILNSEWTIWHERQKLDAGGLNEAAYMAALSNVGSFQTLKEFWQLWGSIAFDTAGTLHVFKTGIKPIWEDPANQDGGKWVVTINQEHEDHQRVMKMWFSLVVAVLCGQLEYHEDMCGIVLAVRNWGTGLHIWNMHSGDIDKQDLVKQSLHKLLRTKKIKYVRHQTSILKNMNTHSDSEGSRPRANPWDKKKFQDYNDREFKNRGNRSSPPTVQPEIPGGRPRRFSVGSEAKPDLEPAPVRPSFAAPAKNPWNAPKSGVPPAPPAMETLSESELDPPKRATPAPPAPIKNPWKAPPKVAPTLAPAPATTPAPAPVSTPAPQPTPTPTPVPAPPASNVDSSSELSGSESSHPTNASFAPTNPWKKPPKKSDTDTNTQPTQPTPKATPAEPVPAPTPAPTESKKQNKHKLQTTSDVERQPKKTAPSAPKEKAVPAPPAWDGHKVIKSLEKADDTAFQPAAEPAAKPPKPINNAKLKKNLWRNYATDPSSGEEDNSSRRRPLPQSGNAAPVFAVPDAPYRPNHPPASTTSTSTSTSTSSTPATTPAVETPTAPNTTPSTTATTPATTTTGDSWSVIADKPKPKRKPRQGSQDNTHTTQSDHEGYARQRTAPQHDYELLEGIDEEEEKRVDRENEKRMERAKLSVTVPDQDAVKHEEDEEDLHTPTVGPSIASLLKGEGTSSVPSSPRASGAGTPARRKRKLGVRHGEEAKPEKKSGDGEGVKGMVNENLTVLIIAPMAMLALLFLVYILLF